MRAQDDRFLVLIDGECDLCRATGAWLDRRDRRRRFKFEALQSEQGQAVLREHGLPTHDFDTLVLVEHGRAYTRSSASLRIARRLRAPWPLLYPLIVVPKPLRDLVYRLMARNRHRIRPRRG